MLTLSGYCPALASSAKLRGLLRGPDFAAVAGDLVLFRFVRSDPAPHHVGIVRAVTSSGDIKTVEGNTSPGSGESQGDGGGVYCRLRGRSVVYGFVHFG